MNSIYKNILNEFESEAILKNAILTNNKLIYYYLSQLIMQGPDYYSDIGSRYGKTASDRILSDSLIIFRRQVKYEKTGIQYRKKQIIVNNRIELSGYLTNLFILLVDASPLNPLYQHSHEFEKKLVDGSGFQKIYELKKPVFNTLHECGCVRQDDQEEIFHESLIVFWKKLIGSELGIYLTGNINKLDNFRVYNRRFYQSSKLSTYLTGIAKNLFFNTLKKAGHNVYIDNTAEISDRNYAEQVSYERDNPVVLQFLFYRTFIEPRKLRAIVSILQYDCNLEDKEVRMLIGINNARIHSSRLRSHFYEWHRKISVGDHEFPGIATDYFIRRDRKAETLNKKIKTIDLYQRNLIRTVELSLFREEFREHPEFTKYHRVFKYVLYFTATGKFSALSGVPDEKIMRILMQAYKKELFKLSSYHVLLILLFYGSDEPEETIINLLNSLRLELDEPGPEDEPGNGLLQLLSNNAFLDKEGLTNEIYKSNCDLFSHFSDEKSFINMMKENGII
jgi:hypothetical protein